MAYINSRRRFINLTPHNINILHDNTETVINPGNIILRAEENKQEQYWITTTLPIYKISLGQPQLVTNSPLNTYLNIESWLQLEGIISNEIHQIYCNLDAWTYCIVSLATLQSISKYLAEPGRTVTHSYNSNWELVCVADVVRDDKGVIIGCKGFSTM